MIANKLIESVRESDQSAMIWSLPKQRETNVSPNLVVSLSAESMVRKRGRQHINLRQSNEKLNERNIELLDEFVKEMKAFRKESIHECKKSNIYLERLS